MADEKDEAFVTYLNRGKRKFDLGFDENRKPKYHLPGTTMSYTEEQAKLHEGYADLVDVTKMPGQENARKVRADRDALKKENDELKAQLAALSAPKELAAPEGEEQASAPAHAESGRKRNK